MVRLGDPCSHGVLREEYREVAGQSDHKTHSVALRRTAATTGAAFPLQRIHAAHRGYLAEQAPIFKPIRLPAG